MKTFSEKELIALINRSLDDTCQPYIKQGVIAAGGSRDWHKIHHYLKVWQDKNILKLIKDPELADHDETCVEMLSYIDRRSSIPGFLNY